MATRGAVGGEVGGDVAHRDGSPTAQACADATSRRPARGRSGAFTA
ncbi:hypothetical protein Ae263Ps1_0473 [Pseudonocardia sp. Ae263_Ps1]|nr:hypothetical protein Ae263Ps1_0473 [Pseudonocardia sp. Ae263_Ps1]OLL90543.1 hypothetical protein Ae356Ps1_0440c [Pseudonocardia sp. Ae356_Ps1]